MTCQKIPFHIHFLLEKKLENKDEGKSFKIHPFFSFFFEKKFYVVTIKIMKNLL